MFAFPTENHGRGIWGLGSTRNEVIGLCANQRSYHRDEHVILA